MDDGLPGGGVDARGSGMQGFLDEGLSDASTGAGHQHRLAGECGCCGHISSMQVTGSPV
jgi:hypothetical protein